MLLYLAELREDFLMLCMRLAAGMSGIKQLGSAVSP